ncbi:unnamed protein product [Ranitomeya imitator]|uniref:RING-type domain-containing protein n=1 Tax=Ranitomeya imitator TaxID=111125 RepID=A0ABN9L5I8_9NEOB|nr:unnamed protein product [Ranitomeya imitator]
MGQWKRTAKGEDLMDQLPGLQLVWKAHLLLRCWMAGTGQRSTPALERCAQDDEGTRHPHEASRSTGIIKRWEVPDQDHRRPSDRTARQEGEAYGVSPEEVCSAVRYSGTEVPLSWLQSELVYVLEHLIDAASQKTDSELGAFTAEEARSAWLSCGGDMEEAVNLCIIQRRNKVEELCGLGFQNRENVVAALYESAGSVTGALSILQKPLLEPFIKRVWEDKEVPFQLSSGDRQALLRRLLAEHALHSWGRAELALSLFQEGEGRYILQDVVEAVRESQDRDFIKRMLTQECAVCGWQLPRNKMRSLTSCECCICPDCFRMHFTVALKEKHIRDMVCPACEEPEISDEGELLHYFSTLDILLRDTLEEDAYNLFHKKLTERTLMKDPKFLWCTHCSFGFIYEGDQLDVKCPQCSCSFCRKCKRPWEDQHRALSCEDFQSWKRENDAEYQAQGLAVYLQDNGITCPHCKFSYALARGGCMHFNCSQCRHQFCSGCYNTFHSKNKCTVPSCTIRMSLHAHHPRDCLFYLRDWEVSRLQDLLQMFNVAFNTDPPAGTQAGPGGGCRVMEQKETIDGLTDEACGKQTVHGYAGLCEPDSRNREFANSDCTVSDNNDAMYSAFPRSHYKEYLVSQINNLALDPCVLYDLEETITVCKRYLQKCPNREISEDDITYKERLVKCCCKSLKNLFQWKQAAIFWLLTDPSAPRMHLRRQRPDACCSRGYSANLLEDFSLPSAASLPIIITLLCGLIVVIKAKTNVIVIDREAADRQGQ